MTEYLLVFVAGALLGALCGYHIAKLIVELKQLSEKQKKYENFSNMFKYDKQFKQD